MQTQVLLPRVVVDEADRRVLERGIPVYLTQDQLGGVSGADDQDFLAARDDRPGRRSLDDRPREEARPHDEREQEEQVDDPDAARNRGWVEVEEREHQERGDDGGRHASKRTPHVLRGHVAPPAVVEAEGDEDREHDPDHEQDHVPLEIAVVVHGPRVAFEADEPGEDPRSSDQRGVDRDLPQSVSVDG